MSREQPLRALSTVTLRVDRHWMAACGQWLLNSGLFYLGWVVLLKGVLDDNYPPGIALVLAIVCAHLWNATERRFESALVVSLALFGLLFDTLLASTGVLAYAGSFACCPWLAPLWSPPLWALFATALNYSLAWVDRYWWLPPLVGAVGGTLSYVAAIRVGAAHFLVAEPLGIAILAAAWAVVMPLCYAYSRWLRRFLAK